MSVVNAERELIYDSHVKGTKEDDAHIIWHPEVEEAFQSETGYHEEYSAALKKEFAYYAQAFRFQGKEYVMRISFPLIMYSS